MVTNMTWTKKTNKNITKNTELTDKKLQFQNAWSYAHAYCFYQRWMNTILPLLILWSYRSY